MATIEKGYGIKSKTFAKVIYEKNCMFLVMLAFLSAFGLVTYLMSQTIVVYSTFMPYALIPAGILQLSKTTEMIGYVISGLVVVYYALCGFLGRKRISFITIGAVLYTIDTIMIAFIWYRWPEVRDTVRTDLLLHAIFVLYWFMGVYFGYRMKNLPEDKPLPKKEDSGYNPVKGNSSMLRIADKEVKARILLEKEVDGQHICYRRIKRVNELVIDGYVYDEVEMLMEYPHVLSAQRMGHLIEVGCDKSSHSFIRIDGREVARKIRIV